MLFVLFVLLLLILANSLFVAGEFAMVAVSHSEIKELAQKKHPAARLLWPLLNDTGSFDRYIAACQVGITLTSLIAGAYGQTHLGAWFAPFFPDGSPATYLIAPGILVGLTAFQMVLGELIPKSLALQFPTRTAIWTVFPMIVVIWIFRLPVFILNGSGAILLRWMGFQPEAHHHIHSPDEIGFLFNESESSGLLDSSERERMQKALHISDWTVRNLMVPRPYLQTLDLKDPIKKNLRKIARSNYSTLLVYHEDSEQINGYIRCPEVLRYAVIHGQIRNLSSFVHPLLTIPRSLTVQRALDKFRQHRTRVALVVDEYGSISGLLTLRDILAELTGAMGDEFSHPRTYFHRLSDGRIRVSGQMRLKQLQELLGIHWEAEFSATVGGYLFNQLDRLPYRGQTLKVQDMAVEIEKISASAILSVLITPPENVQV